jgi:hypothetical protein
MAAVWVLNMVLVAIPGHFSHDELDWMHLFRTITTAGISGWLTSAILHFSGRLERF